MLGRSFLFPVPPYLHRVKRRESLGMRLVKANLKILLWPPSQSISIKKTTADTQRVIFCNRINANTKRTPTTALICVVRELFFTIWTWVFWLWNTLLERSLIFYWVLKIVGSFTFIYNFSRRDFSDEISKWDTLQANLAYQILRS